VVGVPDGANAENTETENEEPGTPAEQVDREIASAEVSSWWRSLFGFGEEYEAGGGGTGGQFTFANVEELDSCIARWEQERDGIMADRDAIADAFYAVAPPAGDIMSRGQADASQTSLANMYIHSDSMLKYAENYILKLRDSRGQIQAQEDSARDQLRSVERTIEA
jgi:hypothetical protein